MSSLWMRVGQLSVVLTLGGLAGAGCGDAPRDPPVPSFGRGPQYRLAPAGAAATAARPIAGLRCRGSAADQASERFGAHLEVFANRRVVVIPAGIGVAPPRKRRGAYVTGGRCVYPARTREPTGVIEVDSGSALVLGQFFDIWGQPLSRARLLGFRASAARPVAAFVDGRAWHGEPRAIPLRRHAQIVLQVGGHFPPNKRYVFPPGL